MAGTAPTHATADCCSNCCLDFYRGFSCDFYMHSAANCLEVCIRPDLWSGGVVVVECLCDVLKGCLGILSIWNDRKIVRGVAIHTAALTVIGTAVIYYKMLQGLLLSTCTGETIRMAAHETELVPPRGGGLLIIVLLRLVHRAEVGAEVMNYYVQLYVHVLSTWCAALGLISTCL